MFMVSLQWCHSIRDCISLGWNVSKRTPLFNGKQGTIYVCVSRLLVSLIFRYRNI